MKTNFCVKTFKRLWRNFCSDSPDAGIGMETAMEVKVKFVQEVIKELETILKEGYHLEMHKKFELGRDFEVGLLLTQDEKGTAPFLSLSDAFEEYCGGREMEEIVQEIQETIQSCEDHFIWDYKSEEK